MDFPPPPRPPVGSHHHRLALILAVVYLLMEFVFPHFAEYGPFNLNVTINH